MPAFIFPTQGNAPAMHFKRSPLDFLWHFFRYHFFFDLHGAFGADHQLEGRR